MAHSQKFGDATPLLANNNDSNNNDDQFTPNYNALRRSSAVRSVVGVNEELAPDFPQDDQAGASGVRRGFVSCRVCQNAINIANKKEQHVVKCNLCGEATPIKNAPPGRKYVRCPCHCLLVCKTTSQRIACPRPNCKRVISLVPSGPPAASSLPSVQSVAGMFRVSCVYCRDSFLFNVSHNSMARCPHCRNVSSVGGNYGRKRGSIFVTGAILLAIVGLVLLVNTLASHQILLYLIYAGVFVAAFLLFLRGMFYMTMKTSIIEGPA